MRCKDFFFYNTNGVLQSGKLCSNNLPKCQNLVRLFFPLKSVAIFWRRSWSGHFRVAKKCTSKNGSKMIGVRILTILFCWGVKWPPLLLPPPRIDLVFKGIMRWEILTEGVEKVHFQKRINSRNALLHFQTDVSLPLHHQHHHDTSRGIRIFWTILGDHHFFHRLSKWCGNTVETS